MLYRRPEKFTGLPWVRWPPWSRLMPSTVSPGSMMERYAPKFALAPEWGCTLAYFAPYSSQARSRARSSTMSTFSQPP